MSAHRSILVAVGFAILAISCVVVPASSADSNSSYWYVASKDARVIIVFSSENGKPYTSLIDRTGKDF